MENRLSELLENYLARRAKGENPNPGDYREEAGDSYADFIELLSAESALDAAMELEAETTLPRPFGAYTLLRELGRGAAGIVYEALHRDLGRTVALKVLRTGFDTTKDAIERFRREAVACAHVRHDHIVEVYEAGEVDGRPFYAMALLEGKSLGRLAKDGELPAPEELCRQVAGIADALHTMHQKGIVHRDVKPSNIMVEPSGRMVLADFGLARTMTGKALTQTGEALGTPLYMSPEQLLGNKDGINGRTDVYGLGATLYEVMAGRPVFKAEDMQQMIRNILQERPMSPRAANGNVPRECDGIILKSLEKRNEDRYENAAAMRDDLLAFANGETVQGKPISATIHNLRRARAMWIPLTAAAALLIGLIAWYLNRPGTLEITAFPVAEVYLNGSLLGNSGGSWEVESGEHDLTLKSGGFVDLNQRIKIKAGESRSMQLMLIASDPDNPEALAKMAKRYQLAMATLQEMERHRGFDDPDEAHPLFPRGKVRIEDLETFRIEMGPEFFDEGKLEFRAGEKVLYSADFDPEELVTVKPLPDQVKAALKAGLKVTWGFYGKRDFTAGFEVVDGGPEQPDDDFLKKQDPRVIRYLHANQLLDAGLHLAAYRAVEGIDSKPAYAVRQTALEGMELKDSQPWKELLEKIDAMR